MENPLLFPVQKSNLHGSHGWQNPVKFFMGMAELQKYFHEDHFLNHILIIKHEFKDNWSNAATSPRVGQSHEGKGWGK